MYIVYNSDAPLNEQLDTFATRQCAQDRCQRENRRSAAGGGPDDLYTFGWYVDWQHFYIDHNHPAYKNVPR